MEKEWRKGREEGKGMGRVQEEKDREQEGKGDLAHPLYVKS